jgi:hypothetical protein
VYWHRAEIGPPPRWQHPALTSDVPLLRAAAERARQLGEANGWSPSTTRCAMDGLTILPDGRPDGEPVTPGQRLTVALAAVHAARWEAIRALTLDDLDLPNRRITIAGHPQRLGDLSHQALRAWLDHRHAAWPHTPSRHVLVSGRTALGDQPASRGHVNFHLKPHDVSVERIRRDPILHEALTRRPDPLHLTLMSGISERPASQHARIARDLLAEPPGQDEADRHDPGEHE